MKKDDPLFKRFTEIYTDNFLNEIIFLLHWYKIDKEIF